MRCHVSLPFNPPVRNNPVVLMDCEVKEVVSGPYRTHGQTVIRCVCDGNEYEIKGSHDGLVISGTKDAVNKAAEKFPSGTYVNTSTSHPYLRNSDADVFFFQ
jgi:hypothetical protein